MKLIKFEQTNCTPCKMLENFLGELGVKADETINISQGTIVGSTGELISSDEDAVMELAGDHEIMKTPTLILLAEDGSVIDRYSGVGQTSVKRILSQRGLI